ncbi:MAG TPA: DVU0524 family FlgM-associated protein [Syntrophales bacterium]|nr:DVU0524 family FlgM-associated protein [Syntrophales bacterium]
MEIGRFQVQHILRVYSQQLSLRSRESKEKVNKKSSQNDEVTISAESRKRMTVDKTASDLIDQLTNGSERNETSREILDRLSREYGRPLDVESNNGDGLAFKVLNDASGKSAQYLPPSENDQLKKKLFDITRSVVYDQLI